MILHDANNLYKILNKPAIYGCIQKGIPILIYDGKIRIPEGFYKSDHVDLALDELGRLIALTRYNRVDIIESFQDLVKLNWSWWMYSKNRASYWAVPNEKWIEFFEIYKLEYNK